MAKRVQPAEQAKLQKLKILFYGWPGSRKTRTSATACLVPELSPVLWLDARGNPESIRTFEEQPDIIRVEALEDFNDPFIWILKGQPPKDKFAMDFGLTRGPYKTIVIDQLTDVQLMMFSKKQSPNGTLPGTLANKREWDDYNTVLYTMWNFAKEYFSLAERGLVNVIMTAQELAGEEGGASRARPYLEGKSSIMVSSYASVIGRLMDADQLPTNSRKAIEKANPGEEGFDYIVAFTRTAAFEAKDQVGGLPSVMPNPTLGKMIECFKTVK